MNLIILGVVLIILIFIFKSFRRFLYSFAIVDILLRIIAFINSQLVIAEINNILNKIPSSISDIIKTDSNGIICTILLWIYVALYLTFIFYLVKSFSRKK